MIARKAFYIVALTLLPLGIPAADAPSPSPRNIPTPASKTAAPTEGDSRPLPFRGTLKIADAKAQTITVGSRTFTISAATRWYRNGAPARFEQAKSGEWVTGSYRRSDQQLRAITVYLGGKAVSTNAPPRSATKPVR